MITRSVSRVEQAGEAGIAFEYLEEALRYAPSHVEATVSSSANGVVLAEVREVGGRGGVLAWTLTVAGQQVQDAAWTAEAPTLSERDIDTVLMLALGNEMAVTS